MARPRGAVDWDGTCVEQVWPDMGDWMPGAPEALRSIIQFADLFIYTCRIAPVEYLAEHIERAPALVQKEKDGIRAMLDSEGLHAIVIHDKPWKPSVDFYIDDKNIWYPGRPGSWAAIRTKLLAKYEPCGI